MSTQSIQAKARSAACPLEATVGGCDRVGAGLVDPRTGKNGRHAMTGLFRQSVFWRLAGYVAAVKAAADKAVAEKVPAARATVLVAGAEAGNVLR